MKMIIDIPDDDYARIKGYYLTHDTVESTYSYIFHGKPFENIHGEWIPKERKTECSVDIDVVCSECGYVGIEGYAHGYELNELPVQEMKDYIKKFDMNYCPCCGAKMERGDI